METDAKGQLGGMEAGENMRRELAGNSRRWRCGACGRTGLEILNECQREWEELQKEGAVEGKEGEVEVPKELRLGFRDELGQDKGKGKEVDEEKAEPRDAAQKSYPPARPAQNVPQPTGTVAMAAPEAQRVQVRPTSNGGVPAWIDRAIALVSVCLLFMIVKMFLGF